MDCLEEGECLDDTSPEVITLDTTQESLNDTTEINDDENIKIVEEKINLNDTKHNLECMEQTLPPGVAPDGFILIDESVVVETDEPEKLNNKNDDDDVPVFKVIFKNKSIAEQYRKRVYNYLRRLLGQPATVEQDDTSDCVLNIWENTNDKLISDKDENHVNGFDDKILFHFDTNPEDKITDLNIPTYGKKFDKVMKEDNYEIEEDKDDTNSGPKLNCFNCLGNHNMRDCTEPRNPMEINKNRKEFGTRNGPRNVRYHIDDDQKFGHLKPGILSSELRKALGLNDDELPKHIIRMRSLGYPPGWLEEARLEHSGIILYNSEGQIETDPSDKLNDLPDPENKDKYDVKKLHDFPGYNIPPPPGTHDYFWPPEQQIMHSKEAMLKSLKGRKTDDGYKRKKLKLSAPQSADSSINSCIEPIEMEIETHDNDTPASPDNGLIDNIDCSSSSTNPETNDDNLLPPGVVETELIDEQKQINIEKIDEQELNVDKEIINNSMDTQDDIPSTPIINKSINIFDISGLDGSPSLTDLENKKKLLLQELDDSSLQSNPATPVRLNLTNEFVTPTTTTTTTPKCGSVKSVEFGTPIIQSTSRFTKLPSSDKFSKNICDVINFENLPDSTGKYEKISGLLQKVRDTLANIENND
ncbi:hypothetical protein HCN44_007418 [Aphidius gifuensis]|uniref:PSP proline-rich domain-containing protein n=1 Tax=Aphidius gifuensis TaxID=684658 RepID=A0A834XML2_APHGI|nr:zinc finger CCHC domain-containing protein 8 homolog [Aphidius gifuensis]KAF7989108.1 hypothetical protein HCN44_007418 [Aphidius gifuensis]